MKVPTRLGGSGPDKHPAADARPGPIRQQWSRLPRLVRELALPAVVILVTFLYPQYVDSLKAKTSVRVMLDPPRQRIAAADSPARGPANAPIELIEFSDFQCPFCMRANPTVQQVLSTYGDRIRFVYRHYPLPNHPNARPAAEAAACAAEQGKFWPYHDKLFANPSQLNAPDLKQHAVELGLDSTKFNTCVDTHKSKTQVEADMRAGEEAGVNGTPAFFINGRMLGGAQPFEAFKHIIDEELELKKSR